MVTLYCNVHEEDCKPLINIIAHPPGRLEGWLSEVWVKFAVFLQIKKEIEK